MGHALPMDYYEGRSKGCIRNELEARGYGALPRNLTWERLVEIARDDDRGIVTEQYIGEAQKPEYKTWDEMEAELNAWMK